MFKKYFVPFLMFFLSAVITFGQDGAIKGKIVDKATGESIPFANIIAERGGKLFGGATTDFDGYYTIKPLPPGRYNVKLSYVGYKSILMTDVIVTPDAITFQDLKMQSTAEELDIVEVIGYEVPLISKDKTQSGETVTRADIAAMPSRDALGIAATVGGVFQSASGDINIRGARNEASNIYIDGVRVRGSSGIPQSAIEQVSVVTGGIPAKYGDATGGIISITTRGPSEKYYGGVEYLTSGYHIKGKNKETIIGLDPYAYNLLGFNVSGPLLKIFDKTDSIRKPLLGFFVAGELTHIKDEKPSAIDMYKVKDNVLDSLKANPLRQNDNGTGSFENTEYIRKTDLELVKYKQNVTKKGLTLSGKFDVRTGPKINLTFGGNLDVNSWRGYDRFYRNGPGNRTYSFFNNSLFNSENNRQVNNTTWRAYAKFTQKFSTGTEIEEEGSKSTIKNAYYTLHVDYTKNIQKIQDARHKNNLFDYGYIGKFTTYKINTYNLGTDSVTGLSGQIQDAFQDTLYDYEAGDVNPDIAAYTQSYYNLYNTTAGHYETHDQVVNGGGLVNGRQPGALTTNVFDLWTSPGVVYNGYSVENNSQFRILAAGSADFLDNHEISVGFEYEQRTDRYYSVLPVGMWRHMRQLSNFHILELDKNNPQPLYYDLYGTPQTSDDTIYGGQIDYPRLYDGASQFLFDYNLRKELGLATNGTDWIDLNTYSPETFSIDMFSADELLNGGSSFVSYYGYDYTGKKIKSKPTLDDFFNQTSIVDGYNGPTIFDRPIGAYQPIYVAGYIQDKFAFKDLVFNIGMRFDRFDANQKVLKDPFLLFPAITAGEVRSGNDRANLSEDVPSSISDDYIVYVDDIQNPGKILGYRDGKIWYNEKGAEMENANILITGKGIQPYLLDPNRTEATQISSNAFEDYKPQTNFMPRIAFSFPISDEALFFAHYDVLTRRPSTTAPIERLDPTHYMFMQTQNIIINNPNLKPSKTIDYEIGFQQKINSYSSLKIAIFYREMRDQIQVTGVINAYPTTYTTWGNEDFGTINGMTFAYDLRRKGNVRIRASYTLAFAKGTGSSASFARSIIAAGQPNLKTTSALSWDQRHQVQITFDYHYGKGKDYNGPVWFNKKIFEEAGTNFVVIGGSGTPYSKQRDVTKAAAFTSEGPILDGTLNGSRLPWQIRIDAKIDKYFDLEWGKETKRRASLNVYLQVLNVLNTLNVVGVYRATGNPDDDGYLADPASESSISDLGPEQEQSFRELYALKVNNPDRYGLPRRIRLGMLLNF